MAANKPTAVHFSLIFFVMTTIIAGVMAYMYYDDGRELRAQIQSDKDTQEKQKTAALKYSQQVDALKKKIGHELPEVGADGAATPAPGDPNAANNGSAGAAPGSVLDAMTKDIQQYSLTNPPDYKTALRELREALDTANGNYAKEQETTRQLNQTIATLKADYDKKVQTHDTERASAVQARMKAEDEHKVALQAERDAHSKTQVDNQRLRADMLALKNAQEQAIAEKDDRIAQLLSINDRLQDRIDDATRVSFEKADGLVRWVDNTSHLVWINLGSADNLQKRTNFSVYKKNNRGVGVDTENSLKGPEDKKGAIEVTRILGPHLAEARILDEDYYDPIAVEDPIYTPIWSPNQKESFAFVGLIDMDNDGRSDRDLLHDVLSEAGASIQAEVDDEGNRTGGEIDERTKFLVVGEIPKLEELSDDKAKEAAKKIIAAHKDLKEEARLQGVRVITLNDFLAFMGYTPRQRVFRPGDNRPFNLRNGAQSTSTSENIGGNRSSTGQTSGIYSRSKRLGQPTGTGQTSGAYRGSR